MRIYLKNREGWLTIGWLKRQQSGWWKGFSYHTCRSTLVKTSGEAGRWVRAQRAEARARASADGTIGNPKARVDLTRG